MNTKAKGEVPMVPIEGEWFGPQQKSRFRVLRNEGDGDGPLELEFENQPDDPGPPVHWHPFAEEQFTVISGCLALTVAGKPIRLEAGQSHVVPRRVPHSFKNGDPSRPVVFRSVHTPGRRFEELLGSIYDLDLDGRVNARGAPGFLAMMAIVEKYPDVSLLHGPPRVLQLLLAKLFGPVARMLSHRGAYRAKARPGAAGRAPHEPQRMLLTLLLAAAAMASVACAEAYESLATAKVSHELDGAGLVSRVVATMKLDEIVSAHERKVSITASVPWDDVVRDTTFVNHLQLDFNAHGHGPPGRNDIPHVDVHFQAITQEEREAIDCQGEPEIEADLLPEGFAAPAVAEPPFGSCVRGMGVHADDGYDTLTADMIVGYHAGALSFIEPMIDVEKILAQETIELPVPRPARVGRATRYPSTFTATHDAASGEYVFAVSGFVDVD